MTATAQSTDPVWKTALVQDFGPANLVISTKFMENYEIIRSVSGGADLSTFLNKEGNLDVYSVGTANRVARVRQQTGSTEGWIEQPLGIVARQLSLYIPTGGDSNNPNILGLNDNNELTLSTWDKAAGRYTQRVFQPSGATRKIKQFLATKNFDNVYVNVILDNDEVGTNFIKSDGTWASRDWVPIKQSQGSMQNAKAKMLAMCANNPVQTALYAIAIDDEILFAESSSRFSYFTKIGYIKGSDLAVVQDSQNRLNLLALDTSRHLWWKRQKKYQSGQSIEWDDWKQVDGSVELVQIDAVLDAKGMVEVFAIGADDLLYHTRQVGTSDTPAWGTVFPLGNPVPNSIFTVGRSAAGYSEAFSVTHDNRLYRFWQDPSTTQWYNAEILLQQSGEMTPVPAHSVEIMVLDYQGLAQPGAEIRIKASNLVSLNIKGDYYIASQYRTVTLRTNNSGVAPVYISARSLSAPTLFISSNFMQDIESVEVQPNAQLQKQLYGVNAADILEAKTLNGQYLLQGEYRTQENAESLAQISQKSMSLGGPPPASAAFRVRKVGGSRRAEILREGKFERPGPGWRIDHSRVAEQHWAVDFRDGFPRYRELTREDAAAKIALVDSAKALGDSGFLGVDWGDVWNSIKEGASQIWGTIQEFVVTTIIDPITRLVTKIRVVFEYLVDGVTRLFDAVVEFFQQAFDIVEGIWNKIKVFFQQLWEWLAFLFAWGDIQRTADAIEHTMNQSLDYMILGVTAVKQQVAAGFDSMTDRFKTSVDQYLKTISGQTDLQEYTNDNYVPQPSLDASVGHSPLQDAYEENYNKTVIKESKALKDVGSSVDLIVKELEKLANNFQFGDGKEAFDEAVGFFNQIGSEPNNALNLVMAGTIKVMEGIALFGIAAAKGVVLTILDLVIDVIAAVKALLNEEWEIPFVSQLYKLITGKSLTFRPMQILALIFAVPATIFYKILAKTAPFPDDAALNRFTSQFTAQWLAEQSGIAPRSAKRLTAAQAAAMEEWRVWVSKIFACVFATLFIVRIWTDTAFVLMSMMESKTTQKVIGITYLVSGFLAVFLTTPWIVKADAGGFSCVEAQGLNNLRWLLNAVMGPCLGAVLLFAGAPPPTPDIIGSLWGAGNLILAIVVIAMGGMAAAQGVLAILLTLAPQSLRFLRPKEIWGSLWEFTAAGLIVTIVLTYLPIACLQVALAFPDSKEVDDRLLAGAQPATPPEPAVDWQPVLAGGMPLQPGFA